MAKNKNWFQEKMKKFENDPEFLKEYILLLEDEIKSLENNPNPKSPLQCNQCGMIQPVYLTCACGNTIGIS